MLCLCRQFFRRGNVVGSWASGSHLSRRSTTHPCQHAWLDNIPCKLRSDTMETIDSGSLLFIALGCGALCVIGIGLLFSFQILTSVVGAFSGIFQVIGTVLNGGPLAWCGCLLLLVVCGSVIFVTIWLVS